MALVLTIGVTDRTSVLVKDSLSVEHRAASFVSVCGFTLCDENHNITISAEDDISIVDGATTFFTGRVVDVRYQPFTTAHRNIVIKCQDLNAQLGETIVDDTEVFTAEADADIIDALFDEYLPAVDSVTHVDTIQDPLTIDLGPCTLRSALSQISTRTGGYFYVDFDNALHYFTAEADGVAWWLSDVPDQIDTFSYFDMVKKSSRAAVRLDGVFVIGDGVEGWRGAHGAGDRCALVRDNRITTATGVNNRGDAILTKYGNARVVYDVSTFKAGLKAGMDVRFICALYGVDDTFTVRKMTVKWNANKVAYYALELGDAVNPSLIDGRAFHDVIEQSLGPITSPRLPIASMGWGHDLVFSATDNNTVAWAGGDIITADGTTYNIDAGNTGNMTADTLTYIYLDVDTSLTVLQTVEDAIGTATGARIILICVAAPDADAAKDATFQVFGGKGIGVIIMADNIAANQIIANHVGANTIITGSANIDTGVINNLHWSTAYGDRLAATKINLGGETIFNKAEGLLLLGPYGEINSTEWWSLRKQKAAITGAFHQEAGRWLGTRGLMVEAWGTNKVKNPTFGGSVLTSWSAIPAATISAETDYPYICDACMKIVAPTDYDGARTTFTLVPATTYHLSLYMRSDSNVSVTVQLRDEDAGADNKREVKSLVAKQGWKLYEYSFTTHAVNTHYSLQLWAALGHSGTWYVDAVQVEARGYRTSITSGDLAWCTWTGTAHASDSSRTATAVSIPTDGALEIANGSIALWVHIDGEPDFYRTYFSHADGGNNNRLQFYYDQIQNKYYLRTANNAGNLTMIGTQAALGDGWHHIVCTWDVASTTLKLYIDGALDASSTSANLPSVLQATLHIGSWKGTVQWSEAGIGEFATFGRVLSATEAAAMYALQRPLVDAGAADRPGLYILDGQFRIASSLTGNRIEIDADEIAGYDSGGTKQFYLRASDGKALAGGGKVWLDEDGLTLSGEDFVASSVKWEIGGVIISNIKSYVAANEKWLYLETAAPASVNDRSKIHLQAQAPAGSEDVVESLISGKSGVEGWWSIHLEGSDRIKAEKDQVTVYDDLRVGKGLYVGQTAVAPDDNDIWCDGEISTDGGTNRWELIDYHATGDVACSGYIDIQINGTPRRLMTRT